MMNTFVQCVKSPLFVPNLPPRRNFDDIYFDAIKKDTLKDVSANKIVTKTDVDETTYNFDSYGKEVSCKNTTKDKSVEYFYHDSNAVFPTLKVIKNSSGLQAVKVNTKSLRGYCAKELYTRVDDTAETVSFSPDGAKNISKYRKDINGDWQFDDHPKDYGPSEEVNFWI